MKNYLKYLLIVFIIIFPKNSLYGYDYSISDTLLINKYSGHVLKVIDNGGDKIEFDKSIDRYLDLHKENDQVVSVLNKIKGSVTSNLEQKAQENQQNLQIDNSTNGYKSKTNFSDYKVDVNKVRDIWLGYYNDYRKSIGLSTYSYNGILNDTAQEWSDLAMTRGYIDHKRNSGDTYYNYNNINSWFKERGVVCKNISKITFSENIGIGSYKCGDDDCSEELASATKSVFNFYMSEKSYLGAHYKSIINSHFSKIGVGVSIKKASSNSFNFYITTHFCTELL